MGGTGEYRREHVGEGGGIFDVGSLTAEFSYRWSPAMAVFGGGGVSQLTTVDLDLQTVAPTYHAGFDRHLRTLSIQGHYAHAMDQLYGFGTIASNDTFTGDAFVPLADRLYYVDVVVSYTRSQPIEDIGVALLDLRTLWSNAAVGRQLTPWLRGEAFVSLARQASPFTDSTNRLRIGVQIVTSKPLRIQ
jgi:hypothetical protein